MNVCATCGDGALGTECRACRIVKLTQEVVQVREDRDRLAAECDDLRATLREQISATTRAHREGERLAVELEEAQGLEIKANLRAMRAEDRVRKLEAVVEAAKADLAELVKHVEQGTKEGS